MRRLQCNTRIKLLRSKNTSVSLSHNSTGSIRLMVQGSHPVARMIGRTLVFLQAKMKKVLFIATHRLNRSPAQRFRFEQYLSYLEANGFQWELSFIVNKDDDKHFYASGNYRKKAAIYRKSRRIRKQDIKRVNEFDLVFLFREAMMTGTTKFEKGLRKHARAKMIYDFDDAIWLPTVSEGNKSLNFLKNPGKTSQLISLCDLVFAGNQYLADYASGFCNRVEVIPTTIDTSWHVPTPKKNKPDKVCIGWTGSPTTLMYFENAVPVLKRIKEKYGDKVRFKVIGDESYYNEALNIRGIRWTASDEITQLNDIDIGIMPLPTDEWAKGKCGLKGLQYMAMETAALMSPVGVNTEIVTEGVDGMLAGTDAEWEKKLSLLIENDELRLRLGKAGRQTVIDRYSVLAYRDKYLSIFRELTEE